MQVYHKEQRVGDLRGVDWSSKSAMVTIKTLPRDDDFHSYPVSSNDQKISSYILSSNNLNMNNFSMKTNMLVVPVDIIREECRIPIHKLNELIKLSPANSCASKMFGSSVMQIVKSFTKHTALALGLFSRDMRDAMDMDENLIFRVNVFPSTDDLVVTAGYPALVVDVDTFVKIFDMDAFEPS